MTDIRPESRDRSAVALASTPSNKQGRLIDELDKWLDS
jgi:hypothetical protein